MKAICTDKYIIPISSVNYVERHYSGTIIEVYLKHPVAGVTYRIFQYESTAACDEAYAVIATTLARG